MIFDAKSFGEKVRELRKQKGLTLTEMAEKTRRSVSLLSQIENGNVSPSFSSMQSIADALDISRITVKSHVTRILRKLDVTSRTQAAARARELGVVSE